MLQSILTLLVISMLLFGLISMILGGLITAYKQNPDMTTEDIARLRASTGWTTLYRFVIQSGLAI